MKCNRIDVAFAVAIVIVLSVASLAAFRDSGTYRLTLNAVSDANSDSTRTRNFDTLDVAKSWDANSYELIAILSRNTDTLNGFSRADSGWIYSMTKRPGGTIRLLDSAKKASLPCSLLVSRIGNDSTLGYSLGFITGVSDTADISESRTYNATFQLTWEFILK